jgi:16S rRNA processing protein RimM
MDQLIRIGQLVAAHGVDGLLVLRHSLGKKTDFASVESLFIETEPGRFLPYFITEAKARGAEETVVRIEGINTREKALLLLKKSIWLDPAIARSLASTSAPLVLVGYTVLDQGKILGPVLEVIEQPIQLLLRLEIEGKEVLVPVHEGTLDRIDHKKRQVKVVLPEGLLDIYLG